MSSTPNHVISPTSRRLNHIPSHFHVTTLHMSRHDPTSRPFPMARPFTYPHVTSRPLVTSCPPRLVPHVSSSPSLNITSPTSRHVPHVTSCSPHQIRSPISCQNVTSPRHVMSAHHIRSRHVPHVLHVTSRPPRHVISPTSHHVLTSHPSPYHVTSPTSRPFHTSRHIPTSHHVAVSHHASLVSSPTSRQVPLLTSRPARHVTSPRHVMFASSNQVPHFMS